MVMSHLRTLCLPPAIIPSAQGIRFDDFWI
nr:MAG TPA: hypothetical protein [Bacteriophage sp.]